MPMSRTPLPPVTAGSSPHAAFGLVFPTDTVLKPSRQGKPPAFPLLTVGRESKPCKSELLGQGPLVLAPFWGYTSRCFLLSI